MALASLDHRPQLQRVPRLAETPLRLSLLPNDVLPEGFCWRLVEGYIRSISWDADGESMTLGIWGPGAWVSTGFISLRPLELQCLTSVVVEHSNPTNADLQQALSDHLHILEELFQINRVRSAEDRLLHLLVWIGKRFGMVNSQGHRISLRELNLTHKALGDICGLTRVTVTKNLSLFRQRGILRDVGHGDLLITSNPFIQSSLP